ncbi:hypothetical protein DENIS_0576 [Desulfonema ishimotonii]|uniref:Cohesin domain-containing protein n=1 Tax=Desulfonema ishimotonii TaxID=45657 RepID=A0A401FRP1_9BACT|nr:cohesin domain-containing protein [Desulfonema ishimotonii]GBC59637.1 hypothetical protein DENIS_0576 [Desulfonema ishimotonii]
MIKKSVSFVLFMLCLLSFRPAYGLSVKIGYDDMTDPTQITETCLIDPSDISGSFDVNILIQDAEDFAGFEFELEYNSDVVTVTDVELGDFLESGDRTVSQFLKDNSPGALGFGAFTKKSANEGRGADGNGILATITFDPKDLSDGTTLEFTRTDIFNSQNPPKCLIPNPVINAEIASTCKITASAGDHGTISPSGEKTVKKGGSQTYTITPDHCYRIADVKVNGISVGTPRSPHTVSDIQDNSTIHVSFERRPHTITASAEGGGTISSPGTRTVYCGDSRTYTITADPLCKIRDVRVNGTSVGAKSAYTFASITRNSTIRAIFREAGGDINDDESIDLRDAILGLKILSGVSVENKTISTDADINGDKRIGPEEVIYILRKTANETSI